VFEDVVHDLSLTIELDIEDLPWPAAGPYRDAKLALFFLSKIVAI
jgi:hypothetical protein